MKLISMLIGCALCAILLSFTVGGDSYTIHIDSKKVAEHYVHSKNPMPSLVLTANQKTADLSVYYSECGKIGRERVLTLKDDEQKILKRWSFSNSTDEHLPMTIATNELLGLIKSQKTYLVYSSRDVNRTVLASVSVSTASARKD